MRRLQSYLLIFISLFVFSSACTVQRSPVTGKKRAYGYSWEEEKQIGADADKQIQQQYGIYDDEGLRNYVDDVAQDVLANSDMRGDDVDEMYRTTEFTFRVLDSPVVNAFALPGGYVYVTRGLLANLRNEAQLAVVLGHEIGHVAARHASQRAFEQQIGQLALIGGAVAGQELLGVPGESILNLGGQAAQLMFLKYSRDDESESDKLGVEYAAKTKYEAAEGADFFTTLKRLSNQSGQSIPTWASTHPDPSQREERIPQLAEGWRQQGYEMNIENMDRFMGQIDDIVYGNNPRQGFTEDGVFYHPDLEFKFPYPEDWQLINTPTAVQVVNPDQNAIMIFQIDGQNNSAQASVQEFLNQEGVNAVNSSSASNHGLSGYEAVATAQTQEGADVRLYLYSVEYDGNIYRFVTYTLADQFDSYDDIFMRTSNGFDELNDSRILNIQPVRLNVFRANRTGSLQSFLPSNLPMDITPEDVAIANQVELDQTIQEGTWIKIPQQ
ncbi:M48 family metalloprotease [Rhodohalobacter sp. 614A]|uniref:M48 family metalloprotease n=1 Tax=Rhodohalobacter sp. 614A TaxID=2908649 RepID=UPI001F3ABFA5|nr:M48 family metalloprotease [Rhodohalobacter sp. 614A]